MLSKIHTVTEQKDRSEGSPSEVDRGPEFPDPYQCLCVHIASDQPTNSFQPNSHFRTWSLTAVSRSSLIRSR